MKLTKTQLSDLLKELGVQLVDITDKQDEAQQDFNPRNVVTSFLESRKPVILADYETTILPTKLSEQAGIIGGKLKNYIKKASGGLLKDSDLQGKTDEECINLLNQTLNQTKNADTESLRTQIQDLVKEHETKLNEQKTTFENLLNQEKSKVTNYHINNQLESLLKDIPLLEGDNSKRAKLLKVALEESFNPVWNEKDHKIELRKKENIEHLASIDGKIVDVKDYAQNYFKEIGLLQTDTRHAPAGTPPAGTPPAGQQQYVSNSAQLGASYYAEV